MCRYLNPIPLRTTKYIREVDADAGWQDIIIEASKVCPQSYYLAATALNSRDLATVFTNHSQAGGVSLT